MNDIHFDKIVGFRPKSLTSSNAWVGHLPFAAWIIQQVKPQLFVELGSYSGNSYFSFCQSVAEANLPTKCYAVDTWQGDEHSGYYGDYIFNAVNTHNQENYAAFSSLLRMFFDDAIPYFSDECIDILHIDGLHTYEAVLHDFQTWLPKLAPGAIVLFHDTNVRERDFGVWKLWEELRVIYPNNLEFSHSNGLGVLQLNNAPENKKIEWLKPNSPDKQRVKEMFTTLGVHHLQYFELQEMKRQITDLNHVVAERDSQIVQLNQVVAERDSQIVQLNQVVAERDSQITERDSQIVQLNHTYAEQISALYNSRSWRITRLLRYIGRVWR